MAVSRATKVPARPWADMARLYGELRGGWNALISMQQLCEHIARSPYRDLIFGATSMHTLLVGQHEMLEWNCNMLRVEPTEAGRITFSFHEKEFIDPVVWACAPDAVVESFERFVRRVKWVGDEALA